MEIAVLRTGSGDRPETFYDFTGPPALHCSRDDVLVDRRCGTKVVSTTLEDAHTNSRRWLTSHRQNLSATMTVHQLSLRFYPTEEIYLRTSIQYASYNSTFWKINNQQAPFWPRAVKTKSEHNMVFNPGGSTGRLRACSFLGTCRALLCRDIFVEARG